jgi:hypothetical protein
VWDVECVDEIHATFRLLIFSELIASITVLLSQNRINPFIDENMGKGIWGEAIGMLTLVATSSKRSPKPSPDPFYFLQYRHPYPVSPQRYREKSSKS